MTQNNGAPSNGPHQSWPPPEPAPPARQGADLSWTAPLPPARPASGRSRGLAAGAGALALALTSGAVWFGLSRAGQDQPAAAGPSSVTASPSSSATTAPSTAAGTPSSSSTASGRRTPSAGSSRTTMLNKPNFSVSVPLPPGWVRARSGAIYGFEVVKEGQITPSQVVSVRDGAYYGRKACGSGVTATNLAEFGFTAQDLLKDTTYSSRKLLTRWLGVASTQKDGTVWPTTMGATSQLRLPNHKIGSRTTGYVTLRKHTACEGKRTRITVMTYAIGNRGASIVVVSHDGAPGGLSLAQEDKLLRSVRPHF